MDQLQTIFENILNGLTVLLGTALAISILGTFMQGRMSTDERTKQESKHNLLGHAKEIVFLLGVVLFVKAVWAMVQSGLAGF